jgi:hypothetical protein
LFELEYFSASNQNSHDDNSSDIHICIRDSIFSEDRLDGMNKGNSVLRYAENLGIIGANFAIQYSDTITIYVTHLLSVSRHVLYVNVIEPILRLLLISKGHVLLHSACVGFDRSGILLSAPPDTGKTSLTLKCIKGGFSFLSDDMTILRLPNKALCFPKPLTISWSTYKASPDLLKNVEHGRSFFRVRSLIHSKKGRQFMHKLCSYNTMPMLTINAVAQVVIKPPKFKILDIVQPETLKQEISIENLYFLQKDNHRYIESVPSETSVRKAIENTDHAFLFPPLTRLLSQITIKGTSFEELIHKERDILEDFLMHTRCRDLNGERNAWYNMIIGDLEETIAV